MAIIDADDNHIGLSYGNYTKSKDQKLPYQPRALVSVPGATPRNQMTLLRDSFEQFVEQWQVSPWSHAVLCRPGAGHTVFMSNRRDLAVDFGGIP